MFEIVLARIFRRFSAALLISLGLQIAFAQTTGSIEGTLTDTSQAAMPNVWSKSSTRLLASTTTSPPTLRATSAPRTCPWASTISALISRVSKPIRCRASSLKLPRECATTLHWKLVTSRKP